MSITWSSANKNARVTLSNGNLTATGDAAAVGESGRADTAITGSQLIYWETVITLDSAVLSGAGFCNATMTFADGNAVGGDTNGIALYSDGNFYFNNVAQAFLSWTTGHNIGWALNKGTGRWWARNNTTAAGWFDTVPGSQNPVGNIGGIAVGAAGDLFPAYTAEGSATLPGSILARFLASSFVGAMPAGYAAYDTPAAPVVSTGGGFHHMGRFGWGDEELEDEEEKEPAYTEATTEELPVKPLSRKMRKRLKQIKAPPLPTPLPMVDDEEEEAMSLLLA